MVYDVDVGAGDQGILFGYAGKEIGDNNVKSLMVGLDAVGETAILSQAEAWRSGHSLPNEWLRGGDHAV